MKKHFRCTTSSVAVLGLMATFAAGCADTADDEATGQQEAAITSRGIAVNGCAGTALFNIMNAANSANAVNWVAVDQSAISNVSSQLWAIDSQNNLVQVNQQAQQLSQQMASAISQVTNNQNAYTMTLAQQATQASQNAAATTTVTATHQDFASTLNDSTSAVNSWNSGSTNAFQNSYNLAAGNTLARNAANTAQSAFNSARALNAANAFNSAASFVSNVGIGGFAAFGLAGIGPGAFVSTVANNFATNAVNSVSDVASANSAIANTSLLNLARNSYLTTNRAAANQNTAFFNQASNVNHQRNAASVANSTASTRTTSVADSLNSATNAMQQNMAAQNSSAYNQNATNSSSLFSNATSYQNLQQFNRQNMVLQLNFTANSNQAITNLFAGNNNNNVVASNSFNFAFPACGGGAAIGGPVGIGPIIAPAPEAAADDPTVEPVGPALVNKERE
jgi:DNA-binding transcriptional regulator YiaG